ncbi:hypothetical protein V6Z12_A08G161700, partial [Gossypium hirsutum]
MDPPKTPLSFMQPRPPTPSSIPSKLTVNFVLPYASELATKEVDMVIVPATTGQMGVLPGHVATIAELKPGVLSVHEGSEMTKYFVSSGFVFIHANSFADIIAVEAVPLDRLDVNLVQKGLAEFTSKLSSATTDLEKAEAQIGIDVHSALNSALTDIVLNMFFPSISMFKRVTDMNNLQGLSPGLQWRKLLRSYKFMDVIHNANHVVVLIAVQILASQ